MKHIKFWALLLIMFIPLVAFAQSTSEKKAILQQIVRDGKDAKEFVDDVGGITSALESISITKVDLNKDGQSELVVDLMLECGAVGNCPFYVYRKSVNNYNLLLSGGGSAYKILKTKTNGYDDIRSQAHSSATETYVVIYKFESGRYKAKNCSTQKVVGKRVKVIPEKCEQ